ncbi:MAG: DegT/DnrJ/EryC1/StrS aminotransferase family protein [Peptococcaceae bacterium]|nr:DegT/DnrJ/EryC1/StrS aminotransferase family protein [Peptococcaceae bacterium]
MSDQEYVAYGLPLIEDDDIAGVLDSFRSGWLTRGPKTLEFEEAFAAYVGAGHAVAVNSCTSGLHLTLAGLGLGTGDEVITTPLTFVATVNTIIHTGARPVLVDIDPYTMNIDEKKIEQAVTSRTKALVPVHIAGYPCDMDSIMGLAGRHGLKVVEDAAHAVYTQYKGNMIGGIGDATVFSFYATKNLVTGEGGMITTNDEALAENLRLFSSHGLSHGAWNRYTSQGSWFYEVLAPGYKYNMTDIQAALGLSQLKKLDRMQKRREDIARHYNEAFADCPSIELPADSPDVRHAWHLYIIKLNMTEASVDRNTFIEKLKEKGVGSSVHFIPVHYHPYHREYFAGARYPVAEEVFERIVSLPLYPKMSDRDVDRVIQAVREILR